MINVIVSDPQSLVRSGCRYAVSDLLDVEMTCETSKLEDVIEEIREGEYDVAVLGIESSIAKTLDVVERLQTDHPDLYVLLLGSYPVEFVGKQALEAGSAGYLRKKATPQRFTEAVRAAARGDLYVTPELGAALCSSNGCTSRTPSSKLSKREIQVTERIASGTSTHEIAVELKISPKTVSTYRSRIRSKIDAENDVQIARYAFRHQMVGL